MLIFVPMYMPIISGENEGVAFERNMLRMQFTTKVRRRHVLLQQFLFEQRVSGRQLLRSQRTKHGMHEL